MVKGLNKKRVLITLFVILAIAITAFFVSFTGVANAKAEGLKELKLDFEKDDGGAFTEHSAGGWIVENGVYRPKQGGAITKTKEQIDLTSTNYVSFDFCTDAFPFDVFFTENLNASWQGIGVHLYSIADGVVTVNKNLDQNDWLGDYIGNYADGKTHNLKIRIENSEMSFYMDKSETPLAFNGGAVTSFSLGIETLSDKAQLIFRAASENSFIDNLIISATDEEEEPPAPPTPPTPGEPEDPDEPSVEPWEVSLDFSEDSQAENFSAGRGTAGWVISEGKYYPAAAGAVTKTVKKINLKAVNYISFDFYTDSVPFDFFMTEDSETTMAGIGAHLYSVAGGVFTVNKNLDQNDWLGDHVRNFADGKAHNIKIKIENSAISFYADGEKTPLSFNGGAVTSFPLDIETLSDKAEIVFRAASEKSYIDNFIVSENDVEYVEPVQPDNRYKELNVDFSDAAQNKYFAAEFESAGWRANGGSFYPAAAWATVKVVQPISLDKTTYIAFDFFAAINGKNKSESQFSAAFLPNFDSQNGFGIHAYYSGETAVITANESLSRDRWLADCIFAWDDGKVHNMKIKVGEGKVSYYLDGEIIAFADGRTEFDVTVTENEVYLAFQSTETMSRIDNFIVSENDIAYEPPAPYEAFEEFETGFADDGGFIASANGGWVAENGAFSPSRAWATAQYGKVIPLDGEKTIKFNFTAKEDDNGSQFNVGLVNGLASDGVVPSSGVTLHLYKPQNVQFNVSYWFGNPFEAIADSSSKNFFDGETHSVKIVIKDKTLSVVIDNEIIFKNVAVNSEAGYLTFQSTSTETKIEALSIKNKAESLNIPSGEGDISYGGDTGKNDNDGKTENISGAVKETADRTKTVIAIVCGVLTAVFAAAFVAITIVTRKNKNKKENEK